VATRGPVAVTGWGQEEFRERSKAAGFDGHLVKPVDFETFRQLLASLDRTAP
jgi:CheY-like chemotaxis protein